MGAKNATGKLAKWHELARFGKMVDIGKNANFHRLGSP